MWKVNYRVGEGKPDDLSKSEVTNVPNAHDAKGNAALEKREKKEKEKTKGSLVSSANNGNIFGGLPDANLTLPRNARRSSNTTTALIFTPA